MLWGYAGVWAGQYLERDADPLLARLKFLVHYGLKTTGIGLGQIAKLAPAAREALGKFVAAHDLNLTLITGFNCFNPDRSFLRRDVDKVIGDLPGCVSLVRSRLVQFCAGAIHRFVREPALPRQLAMLAEGLTPVAAKCREMKISFGIENHGDYYVSDLVELCRMTPHLGIFLDTGNTYLIGEAPMPAFEQAAPLAVGTHFKDHHVRPMLEARPLHFEVGPAVLGEGDVPLKECYRLLRERALDPDALVMEIELIPPDFSGNAPVVALEKSLEFIRGLEAGR